MIREYVALTKQTYTLDGYSIVPIRDEDKYEIMEMRNEQIYHLRQKVRLTKKDQENYFSNTVEKLFEQRYPDQLLFSYLKNNNCIGYGGLVHINWPDHNAEISFIMEPQLEKDEFDLHWTNFLSMIEQVAFMDIQLHKIFTWAFDLRPHLYKSLLKNKFTHEARLTDHCNFNNKFMDVVIHSKINNVNI